MTAPLPEPRPAIDAPAAADTPAASPETAPASPTCEARLQLLGVTFERVAQPAADSACQIEDPVRLQGLALADGAITWPDRPVVACSTAVILADFTRDIAAPLAAGLVGRRLIAFGTGPGFACRGRNRVDGARISAHGRGLAVDIAWIAFDAGPRISVEAPGSDEAIRFVAALRRAACGWFTTVLGPGSDAAHADHLHLDREVRGQRGDSRLCQ